MDDQQDKANGTHRPTQRPGAAKLLEGQGASACSMPGKMSKRAPAENSLGLARPLAPTFIGARCGRTAAGIALTRQMRTCRGRRAIDAERHGGAAHVAGSAPSLIGCAGARVGGRAHHLAPHEPQAANMLGSEVTESAHVMGTARGPRPPLADQVGTRVRHDPRRRARFLCLCAHLGKAREMPLAIEPRVDRPPPRPHGEINPPSATRCVR